jgi:uncharacterized coiled-coil protein SlyX
MADKTIEELEAQLAELQLKTNDLSAVLEAVRTKLG